MFVKCHNRHALFPTIMEKSMLTVSITFLIAALLGALILVADLWVKNTGVESHSNVPPVVSTNGSTQVEPTINGLIGEGEYAHHLLDELTGIALYWTLLGDHLFIAITSPGHGWVAMGLDPDGPMMKGADIAMGYVVDGETVFEDRWADSTASHVNDIEAGGNDDIMSFAGSESESGTVIEFERSILTGDEFDKQVPNKEVFVQLAYSDKDDWKTYHGSMTRNTVVIDFFATEEVQP